MTTGADLLGVKELTVLHGGFDIIRYRPVDAHDAMLGRAGSTAGFVGC